MLIPLTNITYDIQEALEYYQTVENNYQDLMWTKRETVEYLNRGKMTIRSDKDKDEDEQWKQFLAAVNYKEPFISWTKEQCLEFGREHYYKFTSGMKIWNIKMSEVNTPHPKLQRQQELQFGFAKKILDKFPNAEVFELIYSSPGTKFNKHIDEGDYCRLIIPIIADEGAVWHFSDKSNVTQFPGHFYMLLKQYEHGTDVLGPGPRVNLHFLLPIEQKEELLNLNWVV